MSRGFSCARAMGIVASLLFGCASGSLRFSATPAGHLETEACSAPDTPPDLTEPRFLPTMSGNLTLVRATGDARLSAEGGIIAAWSLDGAVVAFADHGAVSVWRAADGALLDLVRCVPGDLGPNEIALSHDLRWVVVTGFVREPTDTAATCIVDRRTALARIVPGETESLSFDATSRTLRGARRTFDLESGAVREVTPSTDAPAGRRSSTAGIRSPDRRYVVTSSECVVERRAAPKASEPAPRPTDSFVAVTELATGKLLWRASEAPCGQWRFSPDGRFVQKGSKIRDARTGRTGRYVVGATSLAGPALTIWDLDNPERAVDMLLKHGFETGALSPDERFVAAGDAAGTVYLWTRGGVAIALEGRGSSAVRKLAFSSDGRLLAAGFEHGSVMVFDTKSGRVSGRIELPSQRPSFLWWTADGTRLVIDTTRHFRFEFTVR